MCGQILSVLVDGSSDTSNQGMVVMPEKKKRDLSSYSNTLTSLFGYKASHSRAVVLNPNYSTTRIFEKKIPQPTIDIFGLI